MSPDFERILDTLTRTIKAYLFEYSHETISKENKKIKKHINRRIKELDPAFVNKIIKEWCPNNPLIEILQRHYDLWEQRVISLWEPLFKKRDNIMNKTETWRAMGFSRGKGTKIRYYVYEDEISIEKDRLVCWYPPIITDLYLYDILEEFVEIRLNSEFNFLPQK